jgi:hypothetical protein
MKIFVGFGYNDRDLWVKNMVIPVVEAFDVEVLTGEEIYGEELTEGVRETIKKADAVIGFLTRRGAPSSEGVWDTHRWVSDELLFAKTCGLKVLEVRETGVNSQGGMLGDLQRITYDENKLAECIVELVKAIGKWRRGANIRFQLLPQNFSDEIYPHLSNLRCVYRYMDENDDRVSKDFPAEIRRIKGGLFVLAKGIPTGSLIEVQVECKGNVWLSGWVGTDSHNITLSKQ